MLKYTRQPRGTADATTPLSSQPRSEKPDEKAAELPEYMTISDIAEYLGLDYSFVRLQLRHFPGVLLLSSPGSRTNRKKCLVPRQVFEAWIRKNTLKELDQPNTFKRQAKARVVARRRFMKMDSGGCSVQ